MSSPISFAGIASGIDTNALLNAQLASIRQTRVAPKEERKTELEGANTAFEELRSLLDTFRTKVLEFGSLAGGAISKSGTSSDESTVIVSTTNAAQTGSYTINSISSIAKNHTFSFNQTYSSSSEPINSSIDNLASSTDRTISIQVGNDKTIELELTNSTTIADLASQINDSGDGLINASVINVGSTTTPSYKLFLTTTNTGIDKGLLTVTNGPQIGALGGTTETAATDAVFSISGISGSITRSTNIINDVLVGTTLELQNTSASPITVNITNDTQNTTSKVKSLITLYNEIVEFIRSNNQVTRDESNNEVTNNFAPLSQTNIDDAILNQLREDFASSTSSGTGTVRIFADLGITTEKDGTLKFDENVFEEVINGEPSNVASILLSFAQTVGATKGTIDLYTRFNGFIDITVTSNDDQISNFNSRIQEIEAQIARQEESMRARFGRLEGLIGKMNSVQASLASSLQ